MERIYVDYERVGMEYDNITQVCADEVAAKAHVKATGQPAAYLVTICGPGRTDVEFSLKRDDLIVGFGASENFRDFTMKFNSKPVFDNFDELKDTCETIPIVSMNAVFTSIRVKLYACSDYKLEYYCVMVEGGSEHRHRELLEVDHASHCNVRAKIIYNRGIVTRQDDPRTTVLIAIRYNRLCKLEQLFKNGDLTYDDIRPQPGMYNPLGAAAYLGRHDIVKFLVERGLTTDDIRFDDDAALCSAAEQGYIDIVRFLIAKVWPTSESRIYGDIVLCHTEAHIDILRFLFFECGTTVDDFRTHNLLQKSLMRRSLDSLKFLINSVGLAKAEIAQHENPFCFATRKKDIDIVKFLINDVKLTAVDVRKSNNHILQATAMFDVTDTLKFLFDNVDLTPEDARFALHHAVLHGHLDTARFLVTKAGLI